MNETLTYFAINCLPVWIIVFYALAGAAGIIHLRGQFRRRALSANELLLWVLFVVLVPFGGFLVLILFHNQDKQKRG